MPQGVEVQVLSWALEKKRVSQERAFSFAQAQNCAGHSFGGLEKVASSFAKRATTCTESVGFKSSPGHQSVKQKTAHL